MLVRRGCGNDPRRAWNIGERERTKSLGLSPSKRLYSRVMWRRRGTSQASAKLIVLLTVLRLFKGNVAAILKLNVAYVLLIPVLSSFQSLFDGMWGL